jgi:hypothetical protein
MRRTRSFAFCKSHCDIWWSSGDPEKPPKPNWGRGGGVGRPQHQTAGAIGFGVPGIYLWPRRACGGRRVTAKGFQNQAGVGGGFGRPQNQTAGAIGFGVPGIMCWPRRAY